MTMNPTSSEGIPTQLGKYTIQAVLGRGGMGVVYKALDPGMNRHVAIKTLTQDFGSDGSTLKRFYREAEKTGRLTHPNIIIIYELGEQDGQPYIVMEFVEGRTLDSLLQDAEQLSILHKLRIIEQVCNALGFAHANGVIHRDVKPANVIVRPDGIAKLLDFGIAVQEKKNDMSLTKTGSIIGTVPYMAPERLCGADVDGRSDIFAVGIMLFQILTGSLPFSGDDATLVNRLITEKHPPLGKYLHEYPLELDTILDRALHKIPSERYGFAEEMAGDLNAVVESFKKQHVEHLLARAQQEIDSESPITARDVLLEVLKLDNQHAAARSMLSTLQRQITRKQQETHAAQKRQQAEQAMLERDFEGAYKLLRDASRLLPDDPVIASEFEAARQKKLLDDRIVVYLQQAGEAKRNGNLSAAQAIVQQALDLDSTDSRARQAYHSLIREVQAVEQRLQARKLLDSAEQFIAVRQFESALSQIQEAEKLDPSNLEISGLLSRVREAQRSELRRRVLEELERRSASAESEAQLSEIVREVDSALEILPNDPVLVRYRMQAEQQMHALAKRKIVDDAIQQCRALIDTSPSHAQELIREALARVPLDERLLALSSSIEERISNQAREESRNRYLAQAQNALADKDFSYAIEVLEQCQAESYSEEVAELLKSAMKSESEERKSKAIAACYKRARSLMESKDYEGVISEIERVLQTEPDKGLERMLDDARTSNQQVSFERANYIGLVKELADRGLNRVTLDSIENAPLHLAQLPEVLAIKSRVEALIEAENLSLFQLGQAYSSLAQTALSLDWPISMPSPKAPNLQPTAMLWSLAIARRRDLADKQLEEHAARLASSKLLSPTTLESDRISTKRYLRYASSASTMRLQRQIFRALCRATIDFGKLHPRKH